MSQKHDYELIDHSRSSASLPDTPGGTAEEVLRVTAPITGGALPVIPPAALPLAPPASELGPFTVVSCVAEPSTAEAELENDRAGRADLDLAAWI